MSSHPKPDEFELIRKLFAPLAQNPGALSLTDDAAIFEPPEGKELIFTADALIEGVHFLATDPAETVARKLLRVNLSDVAAMGAIPIGYLLTAAWPRDIGQDWIKAFCAGLALDQDQFGVTLLGGDTVATDGPMALSLTAIGSVAKGGALKRNDAQIDDRLFVSGTIGDGSLGLKVAQGEIDDLPAKDLEYLKSRYRLPEPRTDLGPSLVGIAHAAIDVSDGLIADAGHLAETSEVRIIIRQPDIPLSDAARLALAQRPDLSLTLLSGGDDYELLFTAPAEVGDRINSIADSCRIAITEIGHVEAGEDVEVVARDGAPLTLQNSGWRHF